MLQKIWPKSLIGQLLLVVALALLLAQAISATLIYRAQTQFREAAQVHTAAMRLLRASRATMPQSTDAAEYPGSPYSKRGRFIELSKRSPLTTGEERNDKAEIYLRQLLADQDVQIRDAVVIKRSVSDDPVMLNRVQRRHGPLPGPHPNRMMLVAIQLPAGDWLITRVLIPPGEFMLVATLIAQTLLIYGLLVGAMAWALRRITRPLATLTSQVERFAETRDIASQIAPEGPEDIRRLIVAHNAMEARIAALLNEKDVMLGAIGHDLKTPLAALRVRIESVENDGERERMAATISDIVRTLDDILTLARSGHARETAEMTELSALVAALVEEYEDMEEPVTFTQAQRINLPVHGSWVRRALRNLIDNALRYGAGARVTLVRKETQVIFCIEDDGPGIADSDKARMQEPFMRGEPSRNSATGGTGLGLTLARTIAEQHGGALVLTNRIAPDGTISGLNAELHLPLVTRI